jgi:acetyl-CoA carboxylase carboxyl transferase subunit alpha
MMNILPHEKQIHEIEKAITKLKEQNKKTDLWQNDIDSLETKLKKLKIKVYSELTPWERVLICRHPSRPKSSDYIQNICSDFVEIFGDRTFRDDRAIITGLGTIDKNKFVIISQEKGHDTESRIYHNFGMPHPEGYRKALRAMKLAEKFNLPVITLIDTAGAYPGLSAEERGQGWAIAKNLYEMAQLQTPIITIIIGEGCSGGAIGIGVGDSVAMLEHSYYSVISPEGCASILWNDAKKKEQAASTLKMHPENLTELGLIDSIIKEPLGGAHNDVDIVYKNVTQYIISSWKMLKNISKKKLVDARYKKYRKMGKFETVSYQ